VNDSSTREWKATHTLTLPEGGVVKVMYDPHDDGGPAYTKDEWDALDLAAVDRDGDGKWWIEGKPFTGKVRQLKKRG
jgi:hypothetical protein